MIWRRVFYFRWLKGVNFENHTPFLSPSASRLSWSTRTLIIGASVNRGPRLKKFGDFLRESLRWSLARHDVDDNYLPWLVMFERVAGIFQIHYFGPRVYSRGSYVITHVRLWSVRGPSVVHGPSLNISKTVHCFFLIFCMKLVHHKGTKVTEPDFWKKILGGHKWGKTPIFGVFLMFFVHISASSH